MNQEEQAKFSQRYARFNQTPPSLAGRILTALLGATFLVLAFMFSLVALAVVAVGGLALWGWLWWKTRAIRKQMRQQKAPADDVVEGEIIEGEVISRHDEPANPEHRLR